jgi:hypothetical protein
MLSRNRKKQKPAGLSYDEMAREDGVIQDIRVLGVKNWRNVAMDREDWRKLLKKARAHTGLSSQ